MDSNSADAASLGSIDGDELARRVIELAQAGQMNTQEWDDVQDELARRRVDQARQTPLPTGESLRSQILKVLATTPDITPSELANTLDRSTTVVSRVLTSMLEAGQVTFKPDSNDGRIRHYCLFSPVSAADVSEIGPPSAAEEERQYLGLVIDAAVQARRRNNDLGYAADRLTRALEQAVNVDAYDLALIARTELASTLRQAAKLPEVDTQLRALAEIAAGRGDVTPDLVAPATACLNYELGRRESLPPYSRLDHLTTAATVFERCEQLDNIHDWGLRAAWARLASAELCVEQTQFEVAFNYATSAESIFAAHGDGYGSADATRVLGLCQRLRGNFSEAITVLERAADLASACSAERCRADVLLQLGDALRCAGDLGRAAETLKEAAKMARRMQRTRTLGLSLTALAAVNYVEGQLDRAWDLATEAEQQLEMSPQGLALNTRRRAVIARDLAVGGDRDKWDQSVDYFRRSLEQYQYLRSPAGIAACYLGLGKGYQKLGTPGDVADGLVDIASTRAGRLLLPIDPWIPGLVREWAKESEDSAVRRVADWTYTSDVSPERVDADEMAGEPRRVSELIVHNTHVQ